MKGAGFDWHHTTIDLDRTQAQRKLAGFVQTSAGLGKGYGSSDWGAGAGENPAVDHQIARQRSIKALARVRRTGIDL